VERWQPIQDREELRKQDNCPFLIDELCGQSCSNNWISGYDIPKAMVEVLANRYLPMLQNTLGHFLLGGIVLIVHVRQE